MNSNARNIYFDWICVLAWAWLETMQRFEHVVRATYAVPVIASSLRSRFLLLLLQMDGEKNVIALIVNVWAPFTIRTRQKANTIRMFEWTTRKNIWENYLFEFMSDIYDRFEMFSKIANILCECRHIISVNNNNSVSNVKCAHIDRCKQ